MKNPTPTPRRRTHERVSRAGKTYEQRDKSKANREGTIYQRKDKGLWCAAVTLTSGKRKYLYGRTREDVARKLAAAIGDLQQGITPPDRRETVGSLACPVSGRPGDARHDTQHGRPVQGHPAQLSGAPARQAEAGPAPAPAGPGLSDGAAQARTLCLEHHAPPYGLGRGAQNRRSRSAWFRAMWSRWSSHHARTGRGRKARHSLHKRRGLCWMQFAAIAWRGSTSYCSPLACAVAKHSGSAGPTSIWRSRQVGRFTCASSSSGPTAHRHLCR